jgi:hypothetical protein
VPEAVRPEPDAAADAARMWRLRVFSPTLGGRTAELDRYRQEVWSPYDAFEGAATLMRLLDEEQAA